MGNIRRLLILALAASGVATAGRADVFEVGGQGTVRVRQAAGEVQWIEPAAATLDPRADAGDDRNGPAIPDAALTSLAPPSSIPDAWRASLLAVADRYSLSPDLLAALVRQESGWHPTALSPKGAQGLAQLMPATARALAVDARDPVANLAGGARYLRQLLDRFDGNVEQALAAYNAGPARVLRAGGVPRIAETQAYVSNILLRLTPAGTGQTGFLK